MEYLTFKYVVGAATILALVVIAVQIYFNRKDARISRTIDLVTRYYRDYEDLQTSSTLRDYTDAPPTGIVTPRDRAQYFKNNRNQMTFYRELAMYWKRGLIDKNILKYHLKYKIIEKCSSLDTVYKDKGGANSLYPEIKEMKDDMENMHLLDFRLKKLYKRMNIRQ